MAAARDPLYEDRAELILTQDQLTGLCQLLGQHRERGTFPSPSSSASLPRVHGAQLLLKQWDFTLLWHKETSDFKGDSVNTVQLLMLSETFKCLIIHMTSSFVSLFCT